MRERTRYHLSKSADLTNHKRDKIELLITSPALMNCNRILIDVNRLFHESEQHQINKEYQFSIISLRQAFEITYQLKDSFEQECAKLFRLTIMESLENIYKELKRMKYGLFSRGRYSKSYTMAEETLKEFKEVLMDRSLATKQNLPNPSVQENPESRKNDIMIPL